MMKPTENAEADNTDVTGDVESEKPDVTEE